MTTEQLIAANRQAQRDVLAAQRYLRICRVHASNKVLAAECLLRLRTARLRRLIELLYRA